MRIEKLGDLAGTVAMLYPISFLITGVLDGLFGFIPDHHFVGDGWVWFLKPAFWTFLVMAVYGHAHEQGKLEALVEFYRATKDEQTESR